MSQPLPLQQRVLAVLTEQGAVRAKDLSQWLPGIDRGGLDCAMNALMRANKVSLTLGAYDLVRVNGVTARAPPTAAEEAAASLVPAPKGITLPSPELLARVVAMTTPTEGYCHACNETKPASAFQCSKLGKLYKRCFECAAKAVSLGVLASKERLRRPEGECPQAPLPAHGTTSKPVVREPQGNAGESLPSNLAGGRATVTAEDSLSEPGESSGLDRLPPDYTNRGEVMNPPTSAALGVEVGNLSTPHCDGTGAVPGRKAMGTDAQATQPSAAPTTNTPEKRGNNRDVSAERCCDVASVPETSGSYSRSDPREDVRTPVGSSIAFPRMPSNTSPETTNAPPVAALPVVAIQLDPLEAALLHKRAWLVSKRDVLRLAYEASAQPLEEWIQEIDRVMGRVKRLLEEGV